MSPISKELVLFIFVLTTIVTPPDGVQCQQPDALKTEIYVQSISGYVPEQFVSTQWQLASTGRFVEAEQQFLTYITRENQALLDSASFFIAFSAFHHFVLENKDQACMIAQVAQTKIKNLEPFPYFYQYDIRAHCELNINKLVYPIYYPTQNNGILGNHLCSLVGLYCETTTLVDRQREALPRQRDDLQKLYDLKENLQQRRIFEIQRYNNLHADFDNLLYRSMLDEKIPSDYYRLSIQRNEEGKGLTLYLDVMIPASTSEMNRASIIRKIFHVYVNTLEVFKKRFRQTNNTWVANAKITANNRDLGIAAENASVLESQGITDIEFPMAVETGLYQLDVNLPSVFANAHALLTSKVQEIEQEIIRVENLISKY